MPRTNVPDRTHRARAVVAWLLLAITTPVVANTPEEAMRPSPAAEVVAPIDARDLLERLRAAGRGQISLAPMSGLVQAQDLPWLMQQLDSTAPSAAVISTYSSHVPAGSTVGAEAAFLIDGFRRDHYPPALFAQALTPARRDELRAWWWCWSVRLDRDACEAEPELRLDAALVAAIEAGVAMPAGAGDLHDYTRHYAEDRNNGWVIAIYVRGPDAVLIVRKDALPRVFDGGCDVVNLLYDVRRKQNFPPNCNGEG